jgi:hypothetical protein
MTSATTTTTTTKKMFAFDLLMNKNNNKQLEKQKTVTKTKRAAVDNDDAPGKSRFTTCPACNVDVPTHRINAHLDENCAETTRRTESIATRAAHEGLPGLVYIDEFLSNDEEKELLETITALVTLKVSTVNGRRSGGAYFGVGWPMGAPATPLPLWLRAVVTRIESACTQSIGAPFRVNQIAINVYRRSAGDWMRAHIDDRKHSGPAIACVSLGAECEMRFTPEAEPERAIDVSLPPRSLQIMAGDSRFKWRHAVLNDALQGELRVSIIFRSCPGHPPPTFQ